MIHSQEECCIKLKAIKRIMESAKKYSGLDVEVIHMCESVVTLADELLGEMENV
jgi:hypothetical protein